MVNQKFELIYTKVYKRNQSATACPETKGKLNGSTLNLTQEVKVGKVGSKYEDFVIRKAQIFKEKLNEKAKELQN